MERRDHDLRADHKHPWWHMLVGCGLMLVAVLLLSSAKVGWGSAIILVALLVCPLSMLILMRDAASGR